MGWEHIYGELKMVELSWNENEFKFSSTRFWWIFQICLCASSTSPRSSLLFEILGVLCSNEMWVAASSDLRTKTRFASDFQSSKSHHVIQNLWKISEFFGLRIHVEYPWWRWDFFLKLWDFNLISKCWNIKIVLLRH